MRTSRQTVYLDDVIKAVDYALMKVADNLCYETSEASPQISRTLNTLKNIIRGLPDAKNTTPAEIYVITTGEYSDYHVIMATTNRDIAEKAVDRFKAHGDTVNIETYNNGEEGDLKPAWSVKFENDDLIGTERQKGDDGYEWAKEHYVAEDKRWGTVTVYVLADDVAHAAKIACDRYAEWKHELSIKYAPEGQKEYTCEDCDEEDCEDDCPGYTHKLGKDRKNGTE